MTTIPPVPLEILDSILRSFYVHRETLHLKRFSVVSKIWLLSCRRYLFRSIRIERAEDFRDFLAFLRTIEIRLGYVKRLSLCGAERERDWRTRGPLETLGLYGYTPQLTDIYGSQVSSILSQLPSLQYLHLDKFYIKTNPCRSGNLTGDKGDQFHQYSLPFLELKQCLVGTAVPLVQLLSQFKSLGRVKINDCNRTPHYLRANIDPGLDDWAVQRLPVPVAINSLSLTFPFSVEDLRLHLISNVIMKSIDPEAVHELGFYGCEPCHHEQIVGILQATGPNLRRLILNLGYIFPIDSGMLFVRIPISGLNTISSRTYNLRRYISLRATLIPPSGAPRPPTSSRHSLSPWARHADLGSYS